MAKILLAEDDPAVVEMFERALTGDGHVVVSTGDGLAALEAAQADQFDLLISDVSMPSMDGIALIERLRVGQPQLPVILMSAVADELTRATQLVANHVRVLNKPVTLEQLRAEMGLALA